MKAVLVYGSWFTFAIILYLLLINIFGFIWIWRIKSSKRHFDLNLIIANGVFAVLALAMAILNIVFYSLHGNAVLADKASASVTRWYLIVFILSAVIMIFWMIFVIACSNNFVVLLTSDKIYLFGLSILNSAIIKVARQNKTSYFLEYVYKKEGKMIYTERCRFWKFSATTKFLLNNYKDYLNLERNNAFFSFDQILKPIEQKTASQKAKPLASSKTVSKKQPSSKTAPKNEKTSR